MTTRRIAQFHGCGCVTFKDGSYVPCQDVSNHMKPATPDVGFSREDVHRMIEVWVEAGTGGWGSLADHLYGNLAQMVIAKQEREL